MPIPGKIAGTRAGRPRSVESHQAILEATLALLRSEGFEAMSIEAIAAKAGVGKKTIYRWWTSKEALVIDAFKTLQQAEIPIVDTGSFRGDLTTMVRNSSRVFSEPTVRSLVINMVGVMTKHREVYKAFYDQVVTSRFKHLAQMIRQAQARKEIRQDIDADDVIGFVAAPFWYLLLFDTRKRSLSSAQIERMIDVIFKGIEQKETGRSRRTHSAPRGSSARRASGNRDGQ